MVSNLLDFKGKKEVSSTERKLQNLYYCPVVDNAFRGMREILVHAFQASIENIEIDLKDNTISEVKSILDLQTVLLGQIKELGEFIKNYTLHPEIDLKDYVPSDEN